MSRTAHLTALAVACALAACGGEERDLLEALETTVDNTQQAIVNGKPELGYPAVGAVSSNVTTCSGTLVGVKTVVTAAHCIIPGGTHKFYAGGDFWWGKGQRHPQYDDKWHSNDVALLLLDNQPPVTPMSISSVPPAVGQALILVGYGITGSNKTDGGAKRSGTNTVAGVSATHILIQGATGGLSNICSGDSGGPSFAKINGTLVQVGIHSTGSYNCSSANDMRVDAYAAWFKSTAKDDISIDGKPSPFTDKKPPTVKITSPADGAQVRGTLEVKVSASDNEKIWKVALKVDGKAQTELKKEPFTWKVPVSEGQHAIVATAYDQTQNTAEAKAQVTVLPPAGFGESCTSAAECKSGLCTSLDGQQFCSQSCQVTSNTCPEETECRWDGAEFACSLPASEEEGGCALVPVADGNSAAPAGLLLLALALMVLVTRRR